MNDEDLLDAELLCDDADVLLAVVVVHAGHIGDVLDPDVELTVTPVRRRQRVATRMCPYCPPGEHASNLARGLGCVGPKGVDNG